MIYLIDGHNLIPHVPGISLDDPNDETHLVLRLRSWAAKDQRRKIQLIFDGGLPGGKAPQLSNNQVKVRFAPPGKIADDILIRQINRAKNSSEYTLVSSDQIIIAAAKARHMPRLTSKQFVNLMAEDKRVAPKPKKSEKPQSSEDELDEWLTLFGSGEERPAELPPPPQQVSPKKERKKRTPAQPAALKDGSEKLDDDEIGEWLKLFQQGGQAD